MNRRRIKKEIKKLKCEIFKRQALSSLRLMHYWSKSDHSNAKANMRICTGNFWTNGWFHNNGVW